MTCRGVTAWPADQRTVTFVIVPFVENDLTSGSVPIALEDQVIPESQSGYDALSIPRHFQSGWIGLSREKFRLAETLT